jgi:hypothetical protein
MDEFERCRPWLEAALEYSHGTHTIEDVRRGIAQKRFLLVSGPKCAMVYEVVAFPQLKILHGFLCGGELQELKSFDPYLQEMARVLGCARVTIAGRPGWARALRDLGYSHSCTIVSKEISK